MSVYFWYKAFQDPHNTPHLYSSSTKYIMISCTGKGIYIPSLFIFLVSVMAFLAEGTQVTTLSFSIALLITAIFSWLVGKQENRARAQKHTLLFIAMEKWGIILGILGLIGLTIYCTSVV